jgi:hypothetical protein
MAHRQADLPAIKNSDFPIGIENPGGAGSISSRADASAIPVGYIHLPTSRHRCSVACRPLFNGRRTRFGEQVRGWDRLLW